MTRKALLCGINNFMSAPDLRGCLNDVDNMRQLLMETYGFQASNIHVLKDQQVVKPQVLQEWKWLTNNAKKGDSLIFHISSHGSYITDQTGDEQDLRDEITCLYDMDFGNPKSYIIDDEWFKLTQQVSAEIKLLIIKDTCHSGGSSRFLGVRTADGSERIILAKMDGLVGQNVDEKVSEEEVANCRFLVPPNTPAEAWHGQVGTVQPSRLAQVVHTSLMSCMETETAADAFINGKYQGAFTYHLCKALRNDPQLGTQALIQQITRPLSQGYSQNPQHEGRGLKSMPTTGLVPEAPRPDRPIPTDSIPTDSSDAMQKSGQTDRSLSAQQMLFEAHMKFMETFAALQTSVAEDSSITEVRRGQRVLVIVHGIGNHSSGYSNDWWAALSPHVGSTYAPGLLGQGRHEVLWSDLVNTSRSAAESLMSPEADALRQSIQDVIEDRRDQSLAASAPRSEYSEVMEYQTRGGEIAIDDFLTYMLNDDIRRQILKRFTDVVEPLLAAGTSIDILSHSWGTVVAYEGLRELEQQNLNGRVGNWFTIGSALSISPVQGRLRPENQPTASSRAPFPSLVDEWINVDAKGDLVGGALRRKFPVSKEYLELQPGTCPRQFWGYDLGCAHSSYFQVANVAVNKDIFAYHIAN